MGDEARQFVDPREASLIGCALRAADSEGRPNAEPSHPYRGCYQRDRDRIIHCSAFRRLDYKTQVFVPHEQDHHRTRLTHTIEVAQIARTLARAVGANEDVVEAVALAHDLGHSPFGHAGEAALDEVMRNAGGFEHNRQSLRVVDYLEHPYPGFRGLNLTNAVRRCLAKHETRYDHPGGGEFDDGLSAPLEGQLVDLADELAFTAADLADALSAGWIAIDDLTDLDLWNEAWDRAGQNHPDARPIHHRIQACRMILAAMADDVVGETRRRIEVMHLATPADVQRIAGRAAGLSEAISEPVVRLQEFLLKRVYKHPDNARQGQEGARMISEMFAAYLADPALLPDRYSRRVSTDGLERTVCDFIAGMTDRYCRAEHARIAS